MPAIEYWDPRPSIKQWKHKIKHGQSYMVKRK